MIYIPKVEFSSDAAVRNKIEAIPTNILILKFFFLILIFFHLNAFRLTINPLGFSTALNLNMIILVEFQFQNSSVTFIFSYMFSFYTDTMLATLLLPVQI